MTAKILVLNCGSSSVKFALFNGAVQPLPRTPMWQGKVNDILGDAPQLEASDEPPHAIELTGEHRYDSALAQIHQRVQRQLGGQALRAVAHRVVHGGAKYADPIRIDAHVLADLKACIPLAPLHQPFALDAIEALLHSQPDLPQIACFDTGFHQTMPMVEKLLPLPWSAWEQGLRRYGFHGLSYEFQAVSLPEQYGDAARGRTLVAHLGSGASLCAMQNLRSVDTTMGFSALDGLMMGTRCGSLDPGAVIYLMEIEKLSLAEVSDMLYHHSGLLGVSGVSSDPRDLLPLEADNERVQAALALYVRRIVSEIGALTVSLGGLDMLVFTGGIGEHNAVLRQRICAALGHLGVAIDGPANERHAPVLSPPGNAVQVVVNPTNEEWVAAWHAVRVLSEACDPVD